MDLYNLCFEFEKAFKDTLYVVQEDSSVISMYDSPTGHELTAYIEFYNEDDLTLFMSFREDISQSLRTNIIAWLAVFTSKHNVSVEYYVDFHYNNGVFTTGSKKIKEQIEGHITSDVTFISEEPIYAYGLGGRVKSNRYSIAFDDGDKEFYE